RCGPEDNCEYSHLFLLRKFPPQKTIRSRLSGFPRAAKSFWMNRCLSCSRARIFGLLADAARFQSPERPSPPYSTRDIFHLTRVTRICQKSVFTKTTCGSPFPCAERGTCL